ncbi:phage tail protein I [Moraxella sp. ZY200743]|uniref:phage tail protein I n=1 Tax=Moraxella sp. ZY200743 TaxID=2911970 RepID=UPI003D7D7BCF
MSQLLPPNSTQFERIITDVSADNTRLDVNISSLSRINDAPDDFLSFLAWQYSVDSWDNNWQPSLKRELIKRSFYRHEIKGTIAAIRQILTDFGYEAKFIEWWQSEDEMPAGSFKLELSTAGNELSYAIYLELNRLINDAKPVSRHLTNMTITLTPRSDIHTAAALQTGDEIIIYPKKDNA